MKVEKKNLNEALRVIGKVVCQTSPVELYRAVRFVGDETGVKAMATDGIETVTVIIETEVESPVDFCVINYRKFQAQRKSDFMEQTVEEAKSNPRSDPNDPTMLFCATE